MSKDTRKDRKLITGKVVSNKVANIISVVVYRFVRHPKYNKYIKERSLFKVHDAKGLAKEGDTVRIFTGRPLSKTKRWNLAEVVKNVSKDVQ